MDLKSIRINGFYPERDWKFAGNISADSPRLVKFRETIEDFEEKNIYTQYQIKSICSTTNPVELLSRKKRPSFRSLNLAKKTPPARQRLGTDYTIIHPSDFNAKEQNPDKISLEPIRRRIPVPSDFDPLADSPSSEDEMFTPQADFSNVKSRLNAVLSTAEDTESSSASSSLVSSVDSSLKYISGRYQKRRDSHATNSSYEMERLISEPNYARFIESYPDSYRRLLDTCLKCINLNSVARRCCSGSRLLASEMWPDRESPLFTEQENEMFRPILFGTNISIIVAGQVNTGKSVLINLLLNAKVIPMDDYRCTTRCVRVISKPENDLPDNLRTQPSSVETLKACGLDDNDEYLGTVRVKEWCGWQTSDSTSCNNVASLNANIKEKMKELDIEDVYKNKKKWKYIEVELKSTFLQSSISFIECPAIDGPKSYDEVDEFVKRNPLAVFLYLIAENDLVSQRDTAFIDHLHHVNPDLNIFFVITKMKSDSMVEINQRDKFTSTSCSSTSSPFPEASSQEEERARLETILKSLQKSKYFPYQDLRCSDIDDDETLSVATLSPYDTISDLETGVERIGFLKFDLFLKKLDNFIKESVFKIIQKPCSLLHTIITAQTDMACSLPKIVWEDMRQMGTLLKNLRDKIETYFESSIRRFAENLAANKRDFIEKTTIHSDQWIEKKQLSNQNAKTILNELRHHIAEDLFIRMRDSLNKDKTLLIEIEKGREAILKAIDQCIENFCDKLSSTHCGLGVNLKRIKLQFKQSSLPPVKLYLNREDSRRTSLLPSNFIGQIGVWAMGIRGRQVDYASKRVRLSMSEEIFNKVAPPAQKTIAPNYKSIVELLEKLLNTTMRYYEASRNPPYNLELGLSHAQNRLLSFDILLEAIETNLNHGFPFLTEENIRNSAYYSMLSATHNSKFNLSIKSLLSFRPEGNYVSDTYSLRVNYGSFEASNIIVRKFSTHSFTQMEKFITRLAIGRLVYGKTLKLLHRPIGYCLDTSCQLIVFLPKLQTCVYSELADSIGPKWNTTQGFYITRQIARACELLSSYKELRQVDLRPENILLNYNTDRGGDANHKFHVTVRLSCLIQPNREQQYPDGTGPFHFRYTETPYSAMLNDSELWDQQETLYQLAVLLWWLYTKRLQEPPNYSRVNLERGHEFREFLKSRMLYVNEINMDTGRLVIKFFAKSCIKEMTISKFIDELDSNLKLQK